MDTERSTADNPWSLESLLDVRELAAYLGVAQQERIIAPSREIDLSRCVQLFEQLHSGGHAITDPAIMDAFDRQRGQREAPLPPHFGSGDQ